MSSTAKSRPYLSAFRRSAERNRSLDHHWHTEVYQARLERLKPCRQNHLNDYTIPNATVYKNTYTHTQITTMLRKTQNHNINCAKRAAWIKRKLHCLAVGDRKSWGLTGPFSGESMDNSSTADRSSDPACKRADDKLFREYNKYPGVFFLSYRIDFQY